MRRFLITLLATIILSACGNKKIQQQTDNNGNVIIDTIGNALSEKNMKSQFREYLAAFNNGDVDKALFYIYPDLFEYMTKQYPEENVSIQTLKDSIFIKPMKMMKELNNERKIKYKFVIGDVSKKTNYKNSKFYIVLATIETKTGLDVHSFSDEVIAISSDKGSNWKFIQIDQESPQVAKDIIRMKFPESVINELFSKN